MEQGPTEPHAGRSILLLSSGGPGGGYYRVAFDMGLIPTENQFPCRILVACLVQIQVASPLLDSSPQAHQFRILPPSPSSLKSRAFEWVQSSSSWEVAVLNKIWRPTVPPTLSLRSPQLIPPPFVHVPLPLCQGRARHHTQFRRDPAGGSGGVPPLRGRRRVLR